MNTRLTITGTIHCECGEESSISSSPARHQSQGIMMLWCKHCSAEYTIAVTKGTIVECAKEGA